MIRKFSERGRPVTDGVQLIGPTLFRHCAEFPRAKIRLAQVRKFRRPKDPATAAGVTVFARRARRFVERESRGTVMTLVDDEQLATHRAFATRPHRSHFAAPLAAKASMYARIALTSVVFQWGITRRTTHL